jgi:hypothetical protein
MTIHRCIQTTDATTAYRQNVISKELDDAVTNHQGHSGMTARLHYQKHLMEDAAFGICYCHCRNSHTVLTKIITGAIKAHQTLYGVMSLDPSLAHDYDDDDEYNPSVRSTYIFC